MAMLKRFFWFFDQDFADSVNIWLIDFSLHMETDVYT